MSYATRLPDGVRSRFIDNGRGLSMHFLEAGFEETNRPVLLLLHGFPELAYSWRKIMPVLVAHGYRVIAPDQRGYGLTTGWDRHYDGDLGSFSLLNLTQDALGLLSALGHTEVAAVIGHDFGAPVAAWCALSRPEVFRSAVLLSAPFGGPPRQDATNSAAGIAAALAALHPPRKHYQHYYCGRDADANMHDCPQGIHAFLRAYYHCKSADDPANRPFALKSWAADELAKMPKYYIMDLSRGMAETAAALAPQPGSTCQWLSESELSIYAQEFARTGFQGGLQWYRNSTHPPSIAQLQRYSGRSIDVPCCFIAGSSDWGSYQSPGALQAMAKYACTQFRGTHFVEAAGHWVQQEQPGKVSGLLIEFLKDQAH
jgi:pimeloyl-ACP methyl ester carboxylesterase